MLDTRRKLKEKTLEQKNYGPLEKKKAGKRFFTE